MYKKHLDNETICAHMAFDGKNKMLANQALIALEEETEVSDSEILRVFPDFKNAQKVELLDVENLDVDNIYFRVKVILDGIHTAILTFTYEKEVTIQRL